MIGAGRISLIEHGIRDASSCVDFKSLTILQKERWFGKLGRIGSKFYTNIILFLQFKLQGVND